MQHSQDQDPDDNRGALQALGIFSALTMGFLVVQARCDRQRDLHSGEVIRIQSDLRRIELEGPLPLSGRHWPPPNMNGDPGWTFKDQHDRTIYLLDGAYTNSPTIGAVVQVVATDGLNRLTKIDEIKVPITNDTNGQKTLEVID